MNTLSLLFFYLGALHLMEPTTNFYVFWPFSITAPGKTNTAEYKLGVHKHGKITGAERIFSGFPSNFHKTASRRLTLRGCRHVKHDN
jgi:hypothetical protein